MLSIESQRVECANHYLHFNLELVLHVSRLFIMQFVDATNAQQAEQKKVLNEFKSRISYDIRKVPS